MFEWITKKLPCCIARTKGDKKNLNISEEYPAAKHLEISTMFPSLPQNNLFDAPEFQPDSEHIYESNAQSDPSLGAHPSINEEAKESSAIRFSSIERKLVSCKICKKEAEGFCCACKSEKFCEKCFSEFHLNLPKLHLYFPFKKPVQESSVLYQQRNFHRAMTKLRN